MRRTEIVVEVDLDGSTEVRVEGFQGKGCEALTEAIERAIGRSTDHRRTAEYGAKPDALRVKA